MITKDLHAHSVLSLHQEKSLRDHELAKGRLVTVGSAGWRGCGGTCSAPGGVFGCRRPPRPSAHAAAAALHPLKSRLRLGVTTRPFGRMLLVRHAVDVVHAVDSADGAEHVT